MPYNSVNMNVARRDRRLASLPARPGRTVDRSIGRNGNTRALTTRAWIAAAAIGLAACGGAPTADTVGDAEAPSTTQDHPSTTAVDADIALFAERMTVVDEAVSVWREALSLEEAQAAAEAAANLIEGPNGPGYGDRNDDGAVAGEVSNGLLPGLDGTPRGLAIPLAANGCVRRDVLGGSWSDPGAEWNAMLDAIDDWRPDNNTMPTLPSHPMRIVGWATFTLDSDSLDEAHEYAGHAKLHVDISIRALNC